MIASLLLFHLKQLHGFLGCFAIPSYVFSYGPNLLTDLGGVKTFHGDLCFEVRYLRPEGLQHIKESGTSIVGCFKLIRQALNKLKLLS